MDQTGQDQVQQAAFVTRQNTHKYTLVGLGLVGLFWQDQAEQLEHLHSFQKDTL